VFVCLCLCVGGSLSLSVCVSLLVWEFVSRCLCVCGQHTAVSALASFQRTPRTDLLQNGLVGSPCSPRDSQESSPTPQFIVIHTVKGFGIVNKAEIDVFLELSCFFDDPADVGNLISGSSAFSKTSLNIRKFTVPILLKPGLENFEHYFTNV